MRTTVALDDDLLAEAQRLTGTTEKTALVAATRLGIAFRSAVPPAVFPAEEAGPPTIDG